MPERQNVSPRPQRGARGTNAAHRRSRAAATPKRRNAVHRRPRAGAGISPRMARHGGRNAQTPLTEGPAQRQRKNAKTFNRDPKGERGGQNAVHRRPRAATTPFTAGLVPARGLSHGCRRPASGGHADARGGQLAARSSVNSSRQSRPRSPIWSSTRKRKVWSLKSSPNWCQLTCRPTFS